MSVTTEITVVADESPLVEQLNKSGVCPTNCRKITIKMQDDSPATITYECYLSYGVVDALPTEISDELRQRGVTCPTFKK